MVRRSERRSRTVNIVCVVVVGVRGFCLIFKLG